MRRAGLASDPWVDAAAAVRHAVLLTPGVSGVSESATFQTRGPGGSVAGVALTASPGGARLVVGVVVGLDLSTDPLADVARSVRTAAQAAWERARVVGPEGAPLAVDVDVHLVDVAAGRG
ncbi:hypothetical protein [Rubrivirga sp.]|uniref:hypothetical protein n=1 Tax=Rubrivirga sp. TaxID=1885344 RepID=UPI003B52E86C